MEAVYYYGSGCGVCRGVYRNAIEPAIQEGKPIRLCNVLEEPQRALGAAVGKVPVLIVSVDGVERLRLQANDITKQVLDLIE